MLTKNNKWHAVFDEILDEKDNVIAQATFHLNSELIDASKRARLIAAAPDTLAALEAFPENGDNETYLSYISRIDHWRTYIAKPAIAKAEGDAFLEQSPHIESTATKSGTNKINPPVEGWTPSITKISIPIKLVEVDVPCWQDKDGTIYLDDRSEKIDNDIRNKYGMEIIQETEEENSENNIDRIEKKK